MVEPTSALLQNWRKWKEGRASVEELRSLAADIGNEHFEAGLSTLIALIRHGDAIVRYNAAGSLAFEFHYLPATDELLRMLTADADEDCRHGAATALGTLYRDSKNRRVLWALANATLNDPDVDGIVQIAAFKALVAVQGLPSKEDHLRLIRDEQVTIDEAKVRLLLRELSN